MTQAALTHFDAQGQAHMVDVGDKASTRRVAEWYKTFNSRL